MRTYGAKAQSIPVANPTLGFRMANVSLSTVRDYEKGRRTPIGNNLVAIRSALETKGIALTEKGIELNG